MGHVEVLQQLVGEAFDRGLFLHQPEQLQEPATGVDQRLQGALDQGLHTAEEAFLWRYLGQFVEVLFGHQAGNRASAEHALLIEDRIALGTGNDGRLAVGNLDRQGAGVAARLDQQQGRGFVAVGQQERAQQDDGERHQDGDFHFALEDEEQAQQIAEGADIDHVCCP